MLGDDSSPAAFYRRLYSRDGAPSSVNEQDDWEDIPQAIHIESFPCAVTPGPVTPRLSLYDVLNPTSECKTDPPAASKNPHFPASPGNRDIFLTPSSSVSGGSHGTPVPNTSLDTNPLPDVQASSLAETRRQGRLLTPDDLDLLRHLDEGSIPEDKGTLQMLLAKRSDLNLGGKIHDISDVQRSIGGYSDIFTGTYILADGSRCKVAIKKLRIHIMVDQNFQKKLARELYIWSKLNHPRVLPLEGFFIEDNRYPSLVSKWMENGTVLDYLRSHPDADMLQLLMGIAEGLDYLHKCSIVHSDVKPDNVLITGLGEPLLCDFGVSRMITASETFHFSSSLTGGLRGTIRYLSKELLVASGQGIATYSLQSDVWAFGMTSIAILERHPPYSHIKMDVQVILAISSGELPGMPSDFSSWSLQNQIIWRICQHCWRRPHRRPTIHYVLYEISRLRLLVDPVSSDPDEWLKYHFFWLDEDDKVISPTGRHLLVKTDALYGSCPDSYRAKLLRLTWLMDIQLSNELE